MSADLRDQALRARDAGNLKQAVAAWRSLLDQSPEDWRLGLELKRDLKAGLHYPDSDARFRRAARHLPDEDWLAHYAALYAFHGSDLAAIDARAWALLARWPQDARLWAIRGDVARQRRDWPGAAEAFATAKRLDPGLPDVAAKAAEAREYGRLARRAWSDAGEAYRVLVLNLDRNAERMVEIERHFASSAAPWRRLAGVEGSRLADSVVARLTGDPMAPRGTLGCFLSHVAAWEALLAGGDACALIVEDDVIPLLDLPARLGGLGLPDAWDLVFVNDRMSAGRAVARQPAAEGFAVETLEAAMRGFHPDDNAPGADGYLLSRTGAARLLDWVGRDGFAGDVDWRMLAYGMDAAAVEALPEGHARRELRRLGAAIPRLGRLNAFVSRPALIRTVGVSSDREDVNRGE